MRFAAQERLAIENLWGCFAGNGRIEAAVLVTPGHGRTAMLTLSPLRGSAEERAGSATVRAALDSAEALGAAIVQALLEPRHTAEAECVLRAGMRSLAALNYMERSSSKPLRPTTAAAPALPPGAVIVPYLDTADGRRELSSLLEATYEDTLDCPGLAGLRSAEDILEGHRRGGRFDPSLWSILRLDGRPAGAVLLNPAPHAGGCELVYLGLVPSARGRGLGRALLERAIDGSASRGDRAIMLAVDEENAPAQRLYKGAGFRRTARRLAFVAPIARA